MKSLKKRTKPLVVNLVKHPDIVSKLSKLEMDMKLSPGWLAVECLRVGLAKS